MLAATAQAAPVLTVHLVTADLVQSGNDDMMYP